MQPADLLAVVKADGYGHGAVPVGRAALAAGASSLGVALVEEGVELRDAGIDAMVLVLSEPVPEAADAVVQHRLTPVVYTAGGIVALAKAVATSGDARPLDVHLKIDTGMHRVGCRPEDALELARLVLAHPELRLAGTLTHFAVADEPDNPYTAAQQQRFDAALHAFARPGSLPVSCTPATPPGRSRSLLRATTWSASVSDCTASPRHTSWKAASRSGPRSRSRRASRTSRRSARRNACRTGLRYETTGVARIATVPVGYADGVPRALGAVARPRSSGACRCAIAGTITMDQMMLDVGDLPVEVGDEVVLIGTQGDEAISAYEWADLVDTIPYEIVCGIGPRVPRRYRP